MCILMTFLFCFLVSDFSFAKAEIHIKPIYRVLHNHKSTVRSCYERELIKHHLRGVIRIKWQINSQGKVINEKVVHSSLTKEGKRLEDCILFHLRNWRFPRGAMVADDDGNLPFVMIPFGFTPIPENPYPFRLTPLGFTIEDGYFYLLSHNSFAAENVDGSCPHGLTLNVIPEELKDAKVLCIDS